MTRAAKRPCDHIRQYFGAGHPMPCANPYCPESIAGAKMAAARRVAHLRSGYITQSTVLYRRETDGAGSWWWHEE